MPDHALVTLHPAMLAAIERAVDGRLAAVPLGSDLACAARQLVLMATAMDMLATLLAQQTALLNDMSGRLVALELRAATTDMQVVSHG